jgi:hypothetical protein
MLNIRSPMFVTSGLVILVAVAAAQPSTTPMKLLDDVRDRRYCELFVVKRQGVRLSADVYNTLGLNDCPQAAWDAIDTAKVASQFGAFRVIRNGPRHFIMDRLASGDVTRSPADIQGLATRPVATMRLRLLDLVEKRAFYVERTIHRTTDWTFLAGKPVYELVSPKGQVYVMQSYSQIVDPSPTYADLAALGSRLKPPKGWQYRSLNRPGSPAAVPSQSAAAHPSAPRRLTSAAAACSSCSGVDASAAFWRERCPDELHRSAFQTALQISRLSQRTCHLTKRGFNFPAHRNLRVSEGVENLLR